MDTVHCILPGVWDVLTLPYCHRDCRSEGRPARGLEKPVGATCTYLEPLGLAEYLFPRWFGLGWNWPWCSKDSSWEICYKTGKIC